MKMMKVNLCLMLGAFMAVACSGSQDNPGDTCLNEDCSGHGLCALVDGQALCLCDAGFSAVGLACVADDVDPCQGVDCSGFGTCAVEESGAVCNCQAGYHTEGLSCVEDGTTGPCHQVDCSVHGICVEVSGQAECHCDSGYHAQGLACVPDAVDPCDGVECSGHGSCVERAGQAECHCDPGYHPQGLSCMPDAVDLCDGVECSGHGLCAVDAGAASCICDPGYDPDGLTCVESLCHCRERTQVGYSYCTYKQACQTASDCCPESIPAPFVCGQDYPYIFDCLDGSCENRGCTATNQCATAAEQWSLSGTYYVNKGCLEFEDDCTGEVTLRYCDIRQACQIADDCCPANLSEPFVCNRDSPYLYDCDQGACRGAWCDSDSQCASLHQFYEQQDPGGWVNDGCVESFDPCTAELWYASCGVVQACQTAADCCPDPLPEGFRCNVDYPYLYNCDAGRCSTDTCTNDGQCDTYFERVYQANPAYADMRNLGCQEW